MIVGRITKSLLRRLRSQDGDLTTKTLVETKKRSLSQALARGYRCSFTSLQTSIPPIQTTLRTSSSYYSPLLHCANLNIRSFSGDAVVVNNPESIPSNIIFEDESVLSPEAVQKDVIIDQKWYADHMPEGPAVVPVYSFFNPDLEPEEEIELNEKVWKSDVRIDIIHRVVRWQRAKQRQGTHQQKTISERSGTGRKPHPQKGTGRARQGTLRAPHMRGGGRVHGKVPRDYSFKLPKKVRKYGLRSTLTAKYVENNLLVVDDMFPTDEDIKNASENKTVPMKTKTVLNFLKKHDWHDDSVFFVDDKKNEFLHVATNNLKRDVRVVEQVGVNVYDLLKVKKLVISKAALRSLEARLLTESGKYICKREGKFQTTISEEQILKWEQNARIMREKSRAKKELECKE